MAKLHACAHCDTDYAHSWAYDHKNAPLERRLFAGAGESMPYSLDHSDYKPLCRWCHNRYDKPRKYPPLSDEEFHEAMSRVFTIWAGRPWDRDRDFFPEAWRTVWGAGS